LIPSTSSGQVLIIGGKAEYRTQTGILKIKNQRAKLQIKNKKDELTARTVIDPKDRP
jgi:hypothetical protein